MGSCPLEDLIPLKLVVHVVLFSAFFHISNFYFCKYAPLKKTVFDMDSRKSNCSPSQSEWRSKDIRNETVQRWSNKFSVLQGLRGAWLLRRQLGEHRRSEAMQL